MSHFYTPWKRQKTFDFPTFSGGIEMEYWANWVKNPRFTAYNANSFPVLSVTAVLQNSENGSSM